jgi:nucleotide-binding universal stress UspA family protein
MSYAAIMTHVQADPEAAPRLKCAVGLARRFDAAILGVAAEMIPPLAFDGGFYSLEGDWVGAMRKTIGERLEVARKVFQEETQGMGDKAQFRSGMKMPSPAIAEASRAADLIVAGGRPRGRIDAYRDSEPAQLAIASGRPVLVAPPTARPFLGKCVVLAWKDTREARRAMSDAMPFFNAAERVVVLAVSSKDGLEQAQVEVADVADQLRRHGAPAEGRAEAHDHPNGFEILRHAAQEGADLVVLGAYGHTRLGEWVFGGVTFDLLQQDDVYLLFSH